MRRPLGPLLRKARLEAGHSLRHAAKHAGISHGFLSRVETEDEARPPSEAVLTKLAWLYGRPSDEFVLAAGRIPERIKQQIFTDPRVIPLLDEMREEPLEDP